MLAGNQICLCDLILVANKLFVCIVDFEESDALCSKREEGD